MTNEKIKPELAFVFEIQASLGEPLIIGAVPEGTRRVIPILGGTFEGPDIRGTIVSAGGADWQFTRGDKVTQVKATYALRTDDGTLIQVQNSGLRHGPDEVMQRLAAGEEVAPEEYYFRATPRFIAPAGRYDWLNRNLFLCSGARFPDAVRLWFYRVL